MFGCALLVCVDVMVMSSAYKRVRVELVVVVCLMYICVGERTSP